MHWHVIEMLPPELRAREEAHSAAALSALLMGVQMTSPAWYVTSCPAATISSNSDSGTFEKKGSARSICAVVARTGLSLRWPDTRPLNSPSGRACF